VEYEEHTEEQISIVEAVLAGNYEDEVNPPKGNHHIVHTHLTTKPCPTCGGSGEVWPSGVVREDGEARRASRFPDMTCPECGGSGKVKGPPFILFPFWEPRMKCPNCHGTGKEE
jgi:DnaJ-class molecular chaperone